MYAEIANLLEEVRKTAKLTIKPDETYRYKFGQWLVLLYRKNAFIIYCVIFACLLSVIKYIKIILYN